jgi:hypothetical protein
MTASISPLFTMVLRVSSAASVDSAFILRVDASPCIRAEPLGIKSSPEFSDSGDERLSEIIPTVAAKTSSMKTSGITNGGRELPIPLPVAGKDVDRYRLRLV